MISEIKGKNNNIDNKIYELINEMDIEIIKEYFNYDKFISDCIRNNEIIIDEKGNYTIKF